ncbi:phytanoyl-CoA dioxygenase family protein [Gloeothece verrucosa]|uniref:Phytanoyl-CoA dioxygenase n=1 Tax=Gloeothece verrucosa (strain PCC 7822) TaxID=497965 RepID=E0ULI2_GLOV7|nr:phytanoyl-CoA dioxygenase family protein [Gloeothece verrucosa]ADN17812.1 Phytanoyl-CoA dioxygenase [Gloeothece verrucosa PCC 7822]
MAKTINQVNYTETDLDKFALAIKQDGICVIPNVFNQELIEEWQQAFEKLFQERQKRPGGLAPREKARYYLTLPWIAPFANEEVFANRVVLEILNRVFWQEYVMVQLGCDIPVQGSDYQEIHRDFRPLFSEQIFTPAYALAINFPLVEVTPDNGPFQMARGTHLLSRAEGLAKIASGEIPMESFYLKPGDIIVRNPFALHRGSPNLTATPRPMIVMGYVIHWLHTPKVDLTLSQDYYQSLPAQTQQMLRCQVIEQLDINKAETYINFKY